MKLIGPQERQMFARTISMALASKGEKMFNLSKVVSLAAVTVLALAVRYLPVMCRKLISQSKLL